MAYAVQKRLPDGGAVVTNGRDAVRHLQRVIRQLGAAGPAAALYHVHLFTNMANGIVRIFQRGWWADVAFWLTYALLSLLAFTPRPYEWLGLLVNLEFCVGGALGVYGHLTYGLLPRLEGRRGVGGYLGVLIAFFVLGCGLTLILLYLTAVLFGGFVLTGFVGFWLPRIAWSVGTLTALGSGIFLFAYRRRQAERERALEAAKTQAELAYLRGQLNPHFLFNALNSIYVLIERDPARARTSLLGFSDLLRYQLYTSEEARVPLAEELAHLQEFANLNLLRTEEDFQFQLHTEASLNAGQHHLPPLLLLPLVENAFKYSPRQGGCVRARLNWVDGQLQFAITNLIDPDPPTRDEGSGGIGLTNLRRRLQLLYGSGYELGAARRGDTFHVRLSLPLS